MSYRDQGGGNGQPGRLSLLNNDENSDGKVLSPERAKVAEKE